MKIRILADGETAAARANARGRMFEALVANVLARAGFVIENPANTNYAGMEIDIDGKAQLTGIPIYAECKYHDRDIDSPSVQAFVGKYTPRFFRDRRSQGILVALPRLNSHAKAYWKEMLASSPDMTLSLLQEDEVLDLLFSQTPDLVARARQQVEQHGRAGDVEVLVTSAAQAVLLYVISPGAGTPDAYQLFALNGEPMPADLAESIVAIHPDLAGFRRVPHESGPPIHSRAETGETEQIVQVRPGASYFEYQFPAAPEYFVGRANILASIQTFLDDVARDRTSIRRLVFEGNSGLGKSSAIIAASAQANAAGHFALTIDCRSAASPQFVLRLADYVRGEWERTARASISPVPAAPITGFEGAVSALQAWDRHLAASDTVALIVLDQFESIFFLPTVLERVKDFVLGVTSSCRNIVFGFAWKSDLLTMAAEFPFATRNLLLEQSKTIQLPPFGEPETEAMLTALSKTLNSRLRKDLRFLIGEYSQGYPWLLKKLCAHVKQQREKGLTQIEIAERLLNITQLFEDDIAELSAEEEEILRRLATLVPVAASDIDSAFRADVVRSLIDRRLLIRIGHVYDLYWDIFKDYLNNGGVPAQENYQLRMHPKSMVRAVRVLVSRPDIPHDEFRQSLGLSSQSFYNILRDLRLLGIASVSDGKVLLTLDDPSTPSSWEAILSGHVRTRLIANRFVSTALNRVRDDSVLKIDEFANVLRTSTPYVNASLETWRGYATTLALWMDVAKIAWFDRANDCLRSQVPTEQVVPSTVFLEGRRANATGIPSIQVRPTEEVLRRLVDAVSNRRAVDYEGLKPSTVQKALLTLEDLGVIQRAKGSTSITRPARLWAAADVDGRRALFREWCTDIPAFKATVAILDRRNGRTTLDRLGAELRAELNAGWTDSTSSTNAKIMWNWVKWLGLRPDARLERRRPPRKVSDAQGRLLV